MDTKPSIPDVFKGKVVLITGATGFLGKVLLEKLLRSCPGISSIVLLLRSSRGCDSPARLVNLLQSNVFDRIASECPDVLKKVHYITGDVVCENLGLHECDYQMVIKEVSFVFHCAATVRFEDEPRNIFNVNLFGVRNVLELCRSMKKLEALVHVSTAYSFCNQVMVSEDIYPEVIAPGHLMESLEFMSDSELQSMAQLVVKGRPSLYHFSKAMAEIYLSENSGLMPVVIVRPSIVTAAASEPFPGWIDNINGPSGFIALSSKGILKTLLVKKGVYADWVPVDAVINTLIAAAYAMTTQRRTGKMILPRPRTSRVPILNCVLPNENRISWSELVDICIPCLLKYPSLGVFRVPGGTVTSCIVLHTLCKFVSHYLPAFIVDCILYVVKRKMWMVRSYHRMHRVMSHLQHYTTHSFFFSSNNMRKLITQVGSEDSAVFPLDQNHLNWPIYIEDYVHGVRKFYLKESDETLPMAQKKLFRVKLLWQFGQITVVGILLMLLSKRYVKLDDGINLSIMYASKGLQFFGKFRKS